MSLTYKTLIEARDKLNEQTIPTERYSLVNKKQFDLLLYLALKYPISVYIVDKLNKVRIKHKRGKAKYRRKYLTYPIKIENTFGTTILTVMGQKVICNELL